MTKLAASHHDQLLRIVARAASCPERADGIWFEPNASQRPDDAKDRRRRWAATIADGDPHLFDSYLAARNLTEDAFERAISDVSVKDPGDLPPWAATLFELMDSLDDAEPGVRGAEPLPENTDNPFHALLRPFLQLASIGLREKIDTLGLSVSSRAEEGILHVLASRLASAMIHVIDHEAQTLLAVQQLMVQLGLEQQGTLDGSFDGWMERLERYPVLARMIGVIFGNWRNFTFEFLERLDGDLALLQREMFSGVHPGILDGFSGDAGDLHDNGRAVALLVFDGGRRVVYKPKDLRVSAAFLDLVATLNRAGLEHPLHVRRMILRGLYTWEEWVEHSPCRTVAEVERFFYRMGMITRLLQLLGARDFWLDNLVACGEQPVFIDLEMSLQHMPDLPDALLPIEKAAYFKLQETAVPMGIIAMNTPIEEGVKAEDLGALTTLREFQTPFRFSYSSPIRELLAPDLKRNDHTKWTKSEYAPFLNGQPVAASLHFERVLDGYRAMHECLFANQAMLLAKDSPLRKVEEAPLRHIHRDTWTCLRMIADSTRTPSLVDGFSRDMFFEGLMRVALDDDRADRNLVRMIESEMAAFRDLEVPLFLSPASKKLVLLRDGGTVDDYFSQPSLERVFERIENLASFALEEQADFVRSSFSTGHHHAPPAPRRHSSNTSPGRDIWLARAVELGDFLLDQAIRDEQGALAWLGLIHHPDCDLRAMDVLRPDLLSGTCGLAVLFADLYGATKMDRFQAAATGAMASTMYALAGRHPIVKMVEMAKTSKTRFIACGAYYGVGSQIYALRRCAQTLSCERMQAVADAYIQMLPIESLLKNAHLDLTSGLCGLLFSLLPFPGEAANASAASAIHSIAAEILDVCNNHPDSLVSPNPDGVALLDGLPDIVSGSIFALSRYQDFLRDPQHVQMVASAIRQLERRLPADVSSRPSVWSNLLAGKPANTLLNGVNEQLKASTEPCGTVPILDLLENAFAALKTTGNPRYYDSAAELAQELVRRRETSLSWFPDSFAADRHNLSAMHGIGAIAGYFLGLYEPDRFRSIRTLE
jgi:type 2 lantibiotic biosynthesis protein LanM